VSAKPLSWKTLTPEAVARQTGKAIAAGIAGAVEPLLERIEALEKALEARAYKGVFSTTARYAKGNSTTFNGGLWIAVEEPRGSPPGNGWILAVRRGKDAR
jgi:hypothetical protein